MKILMAHNRYQYRGGEDSVMEDELALLRDHGHEVELLVRDNQKLDTSQPVRVGVSALWSAPAAREAKAIFERFQPDILHCHNTFPQLSPSIYWAASAAGVPVVQTLHNFRLLCANGMLTRDDKPCEQCVGRLPWRGVVHRCYRGSNSQSLVLVTMLGVHRLLGTYQQRVARYIALNEFCRNKFIEGGLPAERISIKPNFSPDPLQGRPLVSQGRSGWLYVGRLTSEKGIPTLLEAAALARRRITVIGSGPLEAACAGHEWVDFRGQQPREVVLQAMQQAACLLVPSIWYENMPRTIVEAFASGLPVMASRIGALADMVTPHETGYLFEPGHASDLAACWLKAAASPAELEAMGARARAEYQAHYTPRASHDRLMAIYAEAAATMATQASVPG